MTAPPALVPDQLRVVLTLAAGAATVTLAAGAVDEIDLELWPWGFAGRVVCHTVIDQEDDPVWAIFTSDEPLTVTLSVTSTELDGTEAPAADTAPLVVTGLAGERRLREQSSQEQAGLPLVERRYELRFVDPAAHFWRQHRPVELRTQASLATTLVAHQAPGMTVQATGSSLTLEHDVLCVAASDPSSFYDWALWSLDRLGALLELDLASNTYRFAPERRRPSAPPVAIEGSNVASLRVLLVEPPRHASRVRNADTGAAATVPVANPAAAGGVQRDALVRSPLEPVAEQQQRREQQRLRPGATGLDVAYVRCPTRLLAPGSFLTLDAEISRRRLGAASTWRVHSLRLLARPTPEGATAEPDDPVRAFAVAVTTELAAPSDPRARLPAYRPPRYPVRVEGRIVSEGGGDDDRTWMTPLDERDSRARYQVQIPLWNKRVPSLFLPQHSPGHLFFPATKGQRVLVALGLHEATLERFLDWAPGARLPAASQGNHLQFGLTPRNGTSLAHTFVDSLPVLTLRRTFGRDLQTLIIDEGTIFLEVKEDPTAEILTPRHDVSVVVAAAREQVGAAVRGAIAGVTGSFEGTMGSTTARLDGALDEVAAAVTAAEAELTGKIAAVDAALAEIEGSLAATLAEVTAAVAAARAALAAALGGA